MKYKKKPIIVDAEQFLDVENPPRGVIASDGNCAFHVVTIQGKSVYVNIGEWIIAESDGEHFYPCADEVFKATYDEVKGDI